MALFHSSFIQFHHMRWPFEDKGVGTLVSADDLVGAHPGWSWGAREEDTVDRMIGWIGEHRERPFVAVYNPVCPHHPYHAPGGTRPFPGKDLESSFRNALHYTDENVARCSRRSRRRGSPSAP